MNKQNNYIIEQKEQAETPWKIIISDDEEEIHAVTRLALSDFMYMNRPLEFLSAYSAEETINLMEKNPDTALIFLDVVMESENAGLEAVQYIRNNLKNNFVRIVLRTGQPGQAPEIDVINKYDINDYKEKTELTDQKLLTSVVSSLRTYEDLRDIEIHKEELKLSLYEKEILLKEVHHRVKNNLQIISSLLSIQSQNVKDESALTMFQDSRDRVRSMALIHEKLYQSKNFVNINFGDYVESLATELLSLYAGRDEIELDINTNNIMLSIDQAIPCGLILNELLTNSMKYAFPDGSAGRISVELTEANGFIEILVSDNGVGIPPGVDRDNSATLGLRLINILTGQLEGTVEHRDTDGTSYFFRFKKEI